MIETLIAFIYIISDHKNLLNTFLVINPSEFVDYEETFCHQI